MAAGVAVAAEAGWDRLSLRAVASEARVTPMALYRHVSDADTLRSMVLDAIVDAGPTPQSTGRLEHDLAVWAHAFRDHCSTFEGVAGWLLSHWFTSSATLGVVEGLLTIAAEHGIVEFEAVALTNAVFTYVLMRCEAERQIRSAGVMTRTLELAGGPTALPKLAAVADFYSTAEFDTHFAYGLGVLISGATARAQVTA